MRVANSSKDDIFEEASYYCICSFQGVQQWPRLAKQNTRKQTFQYVTIEGFTKSRKLLLNLQKRSQLLQVLLKVKIFLWDSFD